MLRYANCTHTRTHRNDVPNMRICVHSAERRASSCNIAKRARTGRVCVVAAPLQLICTAWLHSLHTAWKGGSLTQTHTHINGIAANPEAHRRRHRPCVHCLPEYVVERRDVRTRPLGHLLPHAMRANKLKILPSTLRVIRTLCWAANGSVPFTHRRTRRHRPNVRTALVAIARAQFIRTPVSGSMVHSGWIATRRRRRHRRTNSPRFASSRYHRWNTMRWQRRWPVAVILVECFCMAGQTCGPFGERIGSAAPAAHFVYGMVVFAIPFRNELHV